MWQQILPGLRIKLFMTVLLGVIYPLVMTGLAQVLFRDKANGSLRTSGGNVIGSELIGQNFTKAEYFQPRPSAAGNDGYDPTASGGSNYGPTNQKLIDRVKASIGKFRKENPEYTGALPADLVTASASGLDPHLSPDSVKAQAPRVAKARGASLERVNELIAQFTEGPGLGLLGEPRVNVLMLNLELDTKFPRKSASGKVIALQSGDRHEIP
jgi:K+-transporting ATPase ATPase C chain